MTNTYKYLPLVLILCCFQHLLYAQLEVTSGDTPPFEPETILENYFFGGGVEVLSISYNGADNAVGFFDGENSNIGIDRGIILTSGDAVNAEGPNTMAGVTGANMLQGEVDLEQLIPGFVIHDPAVYEIQFIPYDTIVRFTYVWASDEYPEFAPPSNSQYNDVFGFFISGPGINGPFSNNAENIAYLPDGVTPVSINNVNPVTNQTYYQNNQGGTTVEYDGFTIPLEAFSRVIPCDTYNIKIAVSDAGDGVFDSGVFLASGSFGTDALNISVNTFAADSTMVEGCVGAAIEFQLGTPAEADFPLDYTIFGNAINGTDYSSVPLNAFIPAGEDSLTLFFNPLEDGIPEGLEVIFIDIKTNICGRDTFALYINDNQLVPPQLDADATICEGESLPYDARLPIQLPESVTFANNQTFNIPDNAVTNPALSTIEILGAIPEQVTEGSILSVCIDISHSWISDMDIYLISPSGQFLTLTTDNGGSGDNYTQTCFTATAVTEIEGLGNTEPPFTGDYLPESSWEDIYGADMNGVWTLQVSDDSGGFAGTINGWSMTLPPIYSIGYLWEPADGVSNPNLPNVDLSPTTTTTYTVTAFDTYGCSTSDEVTINVIPALPAPTLTCDNSINGQITFSWDAVTGATAYEVNVGGAGWVASNGGTSHTLTGLTDGQVVTIEVRGIGGTCGTLAATLDCNAILSGCALTSNIDDTQDATCFDGNDGQFTVSAAGGTMPYTYETLGLVSSNGTFNGLAAGTYDVNIVDAVGCATVQTVSISQPNSLSFSANVNAISCFGENNTTLIFNASGGTADYEYSIDGTNFQTSNVFENLTPGMYILSVNDANDCSATAPLEIIELPEIILTSSNTAASCNGGTDGTATITATNGALPYTYLWDTNASNQNGPTAVGLALGAYTVTVTDANGCEATALVDVPELSSLEYTSAGTLLNCFGDANGIATVNITSGTEPYTYAWNTNPAQTTSAAVDLPGGTYTVTITDGGGCSEVVSIDVVEPNELTVDLLTPTNALCAGENGTISSTVSGGTGAYTYVWNNGMNTADIGTTAGTYILTVTDNNGCTATAESIITEPTPLSLTTTSVDVLCNGNNDGTITVSASGGTTNFTYSLDNINSQNENIFENLTAGIYTVYVNDDNNCAANQDITISEPDALILMLTSTDESCAGSDGTATVSASNGTGSYTYTWSDGQNTPTAAALNAGMYSVTVADANGCELTESIEVISEAQIQIGVTITDVSCFGASDGEASVIADGIQPISYQWNASAGNQTTPTASNLSGGTYEVIITDGNGCMQVEEVTIAEPAPIAIALTGEDIACNGTATGTASVAAAGGTGSYLYQWNDANMQQSAQITELLAGTYTVTVTDNNGCQTVDSLVINQPTESIALTGAGSTLDCFGDTNGTITLNGTGGTPPYSYSLDNENFSTGNIFIGLAGGEYTVYATDTTGECTAQGTITVIEPPELSVDAGEDIELIYGDSIILEAVPSDFGNYTYTWSSYSPDLNLTCTDCPTPQARPLYQIMYTVTIENENGCIATDDVRVFINKEQPVFVANAFTPNGDSVNDVLYIQGGAAAERVVGFKVFDRWGELVFENRDTNLNDKEAGWDGSFKGQEMQAGVFVWIAEIEFVDGSIVPYKGQATLIR